jgi:hypothetical protein
MPFLGLAFGSIVNETFLIEPNAIKSKPRRFVDEIKKELTSG